VPVALRTDLVNRVRGLIADGTLAPGARVNESQLSVRLGVSRTPLREALASLESELVVHSEHERGFFVAPLSSQEVRDIYPIGRALDLLALRTVRHYATAALRELKRLNRAFLAAKRDPEAARLADRAFHDLLIGQCPNARLLAMMAPVQAAMERYERLYMGEKSDVVRSAAHHADMIAALERDDIEAAAKALSAHWTYGFERLIARVRA
jgi:DNA-binding GntR family transcriptional regulator